MSPAPKDSLITLPNDHLRQKSRRVGIVTDEVHQIIEQMKTAALDWEATRKHEVGVALAAIQIDKPMRIVIIRQDFDNKKNKNFDVFINPEITKLEGDIEEDYEGCLSVSEVYGKVPRYSRIRLRALDENGQSFRARAEGFLARVLQHEIDHVNGVMFVDHIKDMPNNFYKLKDDGKLEPVPYEEVEKTGIFR
jgi:peptide deformylase